MLTAQERAKYQKLNHQAALKAVKKGEIPHDVPDFATATKWALELTDRTAKKHLPVDRGERVSPRYTIVEAPELGDKVSYGFNGDYYPCGVVTKISTSYRRIETSTGRVFFRRRMTGSWISEGCWGLVSGHVDQRNPHF